ncbi:MAG: S1 RNA-binding domain-containing protein [Pirellulaceae bacterium]|nr:S1 RNA-binding domain-containing protein [Pirellulaceae bacterium]
MTSDPSDASRPDQPETPSSTAQPSSATESQSAAKRRIQIGSRLGLDRPRTLKPQVAGADKPVHLVAEPPPVDAAPASSPPGATGAQGANPAAETLVAPDVEQAVSPAAPAPAPPTPPAAAAAPATSELRATKVPKPSVRDPLSAELEAELQAALGGASLDQLLAMETSASVGQTLELETRLMATVVKLHGDHVFLALGNENEGVASVRQFREPPAVGSLLDVVVKAFNPEDGLYELAVPGASIDVGDWSDLMEGSLVEARVTGANAGGLECMVNNIRGFIPASQISLYRVENLPDFVDQRLQCLVTEVNPQRRNLVLSRRAVLEREQQEKREQLLAQLEVGQVREGVVRGIRDFGAFVDLGGVDGLVHVSQLSWERVEHPSQVLTEGQPVKVRIEKIDPETGKIGLSIRSLELDPWSRAATDYPAGTVVKGKVSRIAKFGAFVRLGPGVEGLIHISELSHGRVANVGSVLSEGQDVEVKVLSVDKEAQRIALSLKATQQPPGAADSAGDDEVEEPPQPPSIKPQHQGPLKGGTDRPTGGDKFGLKW